MAKHEMVPLVFPAVVSAVNVQARLQRDDRFGVTKLAIKANDDECFVNIIQNGRC